MIKAKVRVNVKRATRSRKREVLAALLLLGEATRAKLAQYPGPVKYPIRWVHARQRRAYFAKMRALGERPPYRRSISRGSQRLGKSYVVVPTSRGVVVRSRASYSGYVQSAQRQQPFHKRTGWITDKRAVELVVRDRSVIGQIEELLR